MEASDELEFVAAWTLTDGEGRFMFCGLEGEASAYINGRKDGYRPSESRLVPIHGDTITDIELRR
jgi:hypothetical protein